MEARRFTCGLVSGNLKERFERWVGPKLSILTAIGVTPNLLTLMGLILSAASAWFYINWNSNRLMLLLAAVTLLLSGLLDSIDGVLARITGKASLLGGFLDSLSDRYSDAMVLGAITASGLCGLSWGLAALVGSMMVSYARSRAEASGVDMRAVGLAERAERILILSTATLLSYLNGEAIGWGVALLALLSHITVLQRVLHFYKKVRI
ncbi:CDP-alcohol phosphatidyltransferase family protein [Candidatus Bathyarchaeota archaeon]|nr:CDP-alcohol phosphatidyltransferase family protein [Candidatus Bathyarchaeota archaeon]